MDSSHVWPSYSVLAPYIFFMPLHLLILFIKQTMKYHARWPKNHHPILHYKRNKFVCWFLGHLVLYVFDAVHNTVDYRGIAQLFDGKAVRLYRYISVSKAFAESLHQCLFRWILIFCWIEFCHVCRALSNIDTHINTICFWLDKGQLSTAVRRLIFIINYDALYLWRPLEKIN